MQEIKPPMLDYATPVRTGVGSNVAARILGGLAGAAFAVMTIILCLNAIWRFNEPGERGTAYAFLLCGGIAAVGTFLCFSSLLQRQDVIRDLLTVLVVGGGGILLFGLSASLVVMVMLKEPYYLIFAVPIAAIFGSAGAAGVWVAVRTFRNLIGRRRRRDPPGLISADE